MPKLKVKSPVDPTEAKLPRSAKNATLKNNPPVEEPIEPKEPRSAKITALKNAIWLQGTASRKGAATRKRQREPSSPKAAKSKKKARKGKPNDLNANVAEPACSPETVDIPPLVPDAPKKLRNTLLLDRRHKVEPIDFSLRAGDDSVTESDIESDTESDTSCKPGSEESVDDSDSDGQGKAAIIVSKKLVKARKHIEEKPIWSHQASNSSKVHSRVIVRNRCIEISNDDSDMEITSSPVPGLGVTNGQTPVSQGQAPVPCLDPPNDPIEIDSGSESSQHNMNWPTYTNIVHVTGKELSLGPQYLEVKLAVRKAMDFMLERLLFRDSFPSLPIRAIWSRRSFIEASTFLESSGGTHAQEHYHYLTKRFKSDATYVRELSRLLEARLPIIRGNLKIVAVTHATRAYNLGSVTQEGIVALTRDMKYIYPPTPSGTGVNGSKPYQHPAIISILSDFFFGPQSSVSAITRRYFDPSREHVNKFPPATIALVATAVCAAIDEWRTGRRVPALFSSNVYTDIYNNHISLLRNIKETTENGYSHLLRTLYLSASGNVQSSHVSSAYLDMGNMDMDA